MSLFSNRVALGFLFRFVTDGEAPREGDGVVDAFREIAWVLVREGDHVEVDGSPAKEVQGCVDHASS